MMLHHNKAAKGTGENPFVASGDVENPNLQRARQVAEFTRCVTVSPGLDRRPRQTVFLSKPSHEK